jgi:hypothetical protein
LIPLLITTFDVAGEAAGTPAAACAADAAAAAPTKRRRRRADGADAAGATG